MDGCRGVRQLPRLQASPLRLLGLLRAVLLPVCVQSGSVLRCVVVQGAQGPRRGLQAPLHQRQEERTAHARRAAAVAAAATAALTAAPTAIPNECVLSVWLPCPSLPGGVLP